MIAAGALLALPMIHAHRFVASLDMDWRFELDQPPAPVPCTDPAGAFPLPYDDQQCLGLAHQAQADDSLAACISVLWRSVV
jgi:hypothetical protein